MIDPRNITDDVSTQPLVELAGDKWKAPRNEMGAFERIRRQFAERNAKHGLKYDFWSTFILEVESDPKGKQWPQVDPKMVAFLEAYSYYGTIPRSLRKAMITHRRLGIWMKKAKFRAMFEEARQMAIDRLEELAIKTAFRPKDRDPRLIIKLLEAMRPARYSPRFQIETTEMPIERVELHDRPSREVEVEVKALPAPEPEHAERA